MRLGPERIVLLESHTSVGRPPTTEAVEYWRKVSVPVQRRSCGSADWESGELGSWGVGELGNGKEN